jgi:hypothetical protein
LLHLAIGAFFAEKLSMRTPLLSIVAAALFMVLPARQASAQSAAQIINGSWTGYTEFTADYLQGGVGSVSQALTINVYSNGSISGKLKSVVNLNGTNYLSYATLSGKVYESSNQLLLTSKVSSGGDEMPYGIEWCGSTGTLTLYSDSDHSGYYILNGKARDDCGGSVMEVTYSNY